MIIDVHTHIGKKEVEQGIISLLNTHEIYSVACGSDLESCEFISQLATQSKFVLPIFGLHPWKATTDTVHSIEEYLKDCIIIGEIGLDTVWCDVPMKKQEEVFYQQLEIAERRGCPVILHTKGAEGKIGNIIEKYTMPVLVHWYSEENHLEPFLERDCYFSVGPDFETNEAVRKLVKKVPLERLLVETDGLFALSWAFSRETTLEDIPKALAKTMGYVAQVKNLSLEQVEATMEDNFKKFTRLKNLI